MKICDTGDGLDFSELNSEAFQNLINNIINDGVNLDESNDFCDKI